MSYSHGLPSDPYSPFSALLLAATAPAATPQAGDLKSGDYLDSQDVSGHLFRRPTNHQVVLNSQYGRATNEHNQVLNNLPVLPPTDYASPLAVSPHQLPPGFHPLGDHSPFSLPPAAPYPLNAEEQLPAHRSNASIMPIHQIVHRADQPPSSLLRKHPSPPPTRPLVAFKDRLSQRQRITSPPRLVRSSPYATLAKPKPKPSVLPNSNSNLRPLPRPAATPAPQVTAKAPSPHSPVSDTSQSSAGDAPGPKPRVFPKRLSASNKVSLAKQREVYDSFANNDQIWTALALPESIAQDIRVQFAELLNNSEIQKRQYYENRKALFCYTVELCCRRSRHIIMFSDIKRAVKFTQTSNKSNLRQSVKKVLDLQKITPYTLEEYLCYYYAKLALPLPLRAIFLEVGGQVQQDCWFEGRQAKTLAAASLWECLQACYHCDALLSYYYKHHQLPDKLSAFDPALPHSLAPPPSSTQPNDKEAQPVAPPFIVGYEAWRRTCPLLLDKTNQLVGGQAVCQQSVANEPPPVPFQLGLRWKRWTRDEFIPAVDLTEATFSRSIVNLDKWILRALPADFCQRLYEHSQSTSCKG
ncbi:hypothetical protein H4R34_000081 [Dimargaris verticillata]|uniref:Uncharacterized protein n=1 Tax=Dimargaris verticillata TaxID=2761393 RepID=A0A9W8B6U0_9FUNG|nr:hypothetical protein H4R34_000081 [Dimargaris verticillata]